MHHITSIACAISLLAATGLAQGSYGPTGGENLFSIGGSISSQSVDFNGGDVTTTSVNLQGGFGHFLTDVHEVGGQLSESYSDNDAPNSNAAITTGLSGYYNYNFRQNPRTWFYAGPHLGILMVDAGGTDDTNIAVGIHGGVRHWLNEGAAIFVEPRYTISEFNGNTVNTAEVIFGYTVVL